MGFLSRLLGRSVERATENVIRDAVNNLASNAAHNANTPAQNTNIPEPVQNAVQNDVPEPVASPSGLSWGEVMPAEENQFNSGLPYYQYFDKILREGFPGYQISGESVRGGNSAVFTFSQGGRCALIVEILNRKSSAQKLRRTCREQGTPYLRFYHDYHGWWNTKSYVLGRVRGALGE